MMWSRERQSEILKYLGREGRVQTHRLAELLAVSRETVRRDLMELEACGSLARVHGGAVRADVDMLPEPAFSDRLAVHAEVKQAIGRKACELIEPGSTLLIDAGTTTLAFAQALTHRRQLRIITNSIGIAQLAEVGKGCEILLLGGKPHREVPATYGELTLSEIDRFLADYAVISPVALHPVRGATDYELHEAEVARKMQSRAKCCIMLCHAEKIGRESRVTICQPDAIDHLVTDPEGAAFVLPRGEVHVAKAPGRAGGSISSE